MSGIYGMVRYDGAPVTPETLAPMAAAMSFWGPDGHGQWCGEGAGLGHLMLHVTPESLQERLPASIRVAPHLVITADARIDNRDELFDALGVSASGRARTPDSSLILLAYERWGGECVKRLLGDFAFAIWDSRERSLFCARDPFGCMPFVYHFDGKRFIFASDIKGVLARMESPKLYEAMIAAYLEIKTYHAEKRLTFFEDVVKIPPAHTLTLTLAGAQLSRYWSPEDSPEVPLATDADYAEQMRVLFRDSVERRLRSAFPVGSHLSGGLDSSSISVAAARSLAGRGQKLEVFSWSPPPEPGQISRPDNEYARIEAICRAEDLTCQYLPTMPENYFEVFRKNFTLEPTEMMPREGNVQSCAANLGLRVMLSGWGGDEATSARTSGGLAEFFAQRQWHEFRAVAGSRMNVADASGMGKALLRAKRLGGMVRDIAGPHLPDSLAPRLVSDIWLRHKNNCAHPSFARLHRQAALALRGPALRFQPNIRATSCQLLDCGHIARRVEHWAASGARHRLVYRYPMLDRRIVEFALGIPAIQHCWTEAREPIFRRSVSNLMPAACDWNQRKNEASTLNALTKTWFSAHEDWARHLLSGAPPERFVDAEIIRKVVLEARKSDKMSAWSGVREAFACYGLENPPSPG